jgi:tRNA(Arg) A34 adenosine deaminase TadA
MQQWMRLALEEARQAAHEGEVPVGAVGVLRGKLLAREHNRSLQLPILPHTQKYSFCASWAAT